MRFRRSIHFRVLYKNGKTNMNEINFHIKYFDLPLYIESIDNTRKPFPVAEINEVHCAFDQMKITFFLSYSKLSELVGSPKMS